MRAFVEPNDDGTWSGGCRRCGTSFIENDQLRAESWVSGHDSAVACQRSVARSQPPTFAPAGPYEAMTLLDLRELADTADYWFPDDSEILVSADQAPFLYVFTPPTEEGWRREMLAVLHVDSGTIEDMRGRGGTFAGDEAPS